LEELKEAELPSFRARNFPLYATPDKGRDFEFVGVAHFARIRVVPPSLLSQSTIAIMNEYSARLFLNEYFASKYRATLRHARREVRAK